MARVRDAGLWQAWRERLRRFRRSGETVADFRRRERVSVAAFHQWKRKLSGGGARSPQSGGGELRPPAVSQARPARRASPQFIELVMPARPLGLPANHGSASAVAAGCVEVVLPNGTCVRLASGDLAALRTAILAAAGIGEVVGEGGVAC